MVCLKPMSHQQLSRNGYAMSAKRKLWYNESMLKGSSDELRVVLFVINAQDPTVLKMKAGLESVLQADGIRLQVVFFHGQSSASATKAGGLPRIRELVELWNPVGVVVAAEGRAQRPDTGGVPGRRLFRGTPERRLS